MILYGVDSEVIIVVIKSFGRLMNNMRKYNIPMALFETLIVTIVLSKSTQKEKRLRLSEF